MVAKVAKLEGARVRPEDVRPAKLPTKSELRVVKPSLRQHAYELLREAILQLELKPGRVTSDSELSRLLGMSRTPVREALTLLERDHLVKRIPNQGVLIRELSMDDIVHILQMREAMDGMAARLAVDKIDPKTLLAIESDFKAMRELSTEAAAAVHVTLSRRLHSAILDAAANPFLTATSGELRSAFERTRNYNWRIWNASKNSARIAERRFAAVIASILSPSGSGH